MKTLMTAVALAALVASPAFAATKKVAQVRSTAAQSYASVPAPSVVVSGGQVIGADPDANVRLQLLRDADLPNGD